jgi:hypothetical protein
MKTDHLVPLQDQAKKITKQHRKELEKLLQYLPPAGKSGFLGRQGSFLENSNDWNYKVFKNCRFQFCTKSWTTPR